jgi:two-component system NtrC family sensor kinase
MDMVQAGQPANAIEEYLQRRNLRHRLGNAPQLYETMMGSLGRALDSVKALEGYGAQAGSDFQEMRIEDIIQQVLRDHRQDLEGIQVDRSLEERTYAFHGNPLRMYDLFQNLVLNAIEALEETEEPVLKIATQVSEGVHRTTVEDNGCGMSEEVREHAFEPFYTTKELAEGRQRGLGLFNVWRLVERHSGRIEIESKLGAYTRFHIWFEVAP